MAQTSKENHQTYTPLCTKSNSTGNENGKQTKKLKSKTLDSFNRKKHTL